VRSTASAARPGSAQGADEGADPRDGRRADQDRRRARHRPGRSIEPAARACYDEFCARFPYEETEDQDRAIADVLADLAAGKPMDRLICGDVGFGKTEVALRAAFVVAMSGKQVAVVCPTTLLARQHYKTFTERFEGWPVKVGRLSRLVPPRRPSRDQARALKNGEVDIVIGTHAVLAKQVEFKNLGLVIVDEEQHFGVKHKEKLKALRADVHVLTLTATPIPRTLQMALSGLRELSIIATPPVDRLAVRTYVTPWDPVVVREALLRENYRGGQAFFVAPRIADLRSWRIPARAGAGGEVRRPRPDGADPARGRDERLLRRQVRRAAVDHDRRERPRHPDRQHPDRPPRRHVRPRPALPAARPRRPGQDPRLRLSDHPGGEADHRCRPRSG
jgi:hypothetical protein